MLSGEAKMRCKSGVQLRVCAILLRELEGIAWRPFEGVRFASDFLHRKSIPSKWVFLGSLGACRICDDRIVKAPWALCFSSADCLLRQGYGAPGETAAP